MKRFILFLSILFAISYCVNSATQTHKIENMSTFMGLRWGVNKASFEKNLKEQFKQNSKEFRKILELKSVEVFKNPIQLAFTPSNKVKNSEEKVKKEDLVLTKITIKMASVLFEDMLDVFKFHYGDPTTINESEMQNSYGAKYVQKEAIWDNVNLGRTIVIKKFDAYMNHGLVELIPYKSEAEKEEERERLRKEREERLKRAAKIL